MKCPKCGSVNVERDEVVPGFADCKDCGYAIHESELLP